MIERGAPAAVVTTASIAGITPVRSQAIRRFHVFIFTDCCGHQGGGPYGCSKHAVVSLTESLRSDLTATAPHLTFHTVCPFIVDTKISSSERNRPAELDNPVSHSSMPACS